MQQFLQQSRSLPHHTTSPSISTPSTFPHSTPDVTALSQRKPHDQISIAHHTQYQPQIPRSSFAALADTAKYQLGTSVSNGQTLSISSAPHSASPSPVPSPLHAKRHSSASPSLQQAPPTMLAPSPSSVASGHTPTPSPRTPLDATVGPRPAPLHITPMGRHGAVMENDPRTPMTPQSPYPQQGGCGVVCIQLLVYRGMPKVASHSDTRILDPLAVTVAYAQG